MNKKGKEKFNFVSMDDLERVAEEFNNNVENKNNENSGNVNALKFEYQNNKKTNENKQDTIVDNQKEKKISNDNYFIFEFFHRCHKTFISIHFTNFKIRSNSNFFSPLKFNIYIY